MENTFIPVSGDTASLEALLNSASWEVGILITPSVEPCDSEASTDESEVR